MTDMRFELSYDTKKMQVSITGFALPGDSDDILTGLTLISANFRDYVIEKIQEFNKINERKAEKLYDQLIEEHIKFKRRENGMRNSFLDSILGSNRSNLRK